MSELVEKSYRHCRHMARQAASSFYVAFRLLPAEKRRAMHALYAFSRHSDDLSDSDLPVEQRAMQLAAWREQFEAALDGRFTHPLFPALIDTVERFSIPPRYLLEIIDGVAMDLQAPSYATFDQLCEYCYHVASAVGLACLHVWGFHSDEAVPAAIRCGYAFQMTNILRDLREDADRGRLYLPVEETRRCGVTIEQIQNGIVSDGLRELLALQFQRTRELYDTVAPLDSLLDPDGQRVFRLMFATYRQLLANLETAGDDVLRRRISLTRSQRLSLLTSVIRGRSLVAEKA